MQDLDFGLEKLYVSERRKYYFFRECINLSWNTVQIELKKYTSYAQREHNVCTIRKSIVRAVIVRSLFHFSSSWTPHL